MSISRITALIVLCAVSFAVLLCVYASPVHTMNTPGMVGQSDFATHTEHIQLFTAAIVGEISILLFIFLCGILFYVETFGIVTVFFRYLRVEPSWLKSDVYFVYCDGSRSPPMV